MLSRAGGLAMAAGCRHLVGVRSMADVRMTGCLASCAATGRGEFFFSGSLGNRGSLGSTEWSKSFGGASAARGGGALLGWPKTKEAAMPWHAGNTGSRYSGFEDITIRRYAGGGNVQVDGKEEKEEGKMYKFKRMFRKYGPLFVGFYGGVYVSTLGAMYVAVDQGLIDSKFIIDLTEQYADLLKQYGMDGIFNHGKIDSKAGSFAIAWIATKFTEPVRFAVSVYCVPKLARFLKY
ncbi:DUF1279 domain-containing protein [Chloropicon primus]|uniref:DUF1279 domain-containing protein n=1 Tax=Chloropicon primus TaxID=1764295 RepID=A0A5B8MRD0_9CHLO|nr:hypothetical protein A3770_06p44680 [Chloropicon primus]UPR01170.1 DUF1279 domain-containing protein [Chloropicon primus]|eukprot:QDZ21950.1 hypothetical protein A3770_06p44680 [Chloropicon primus]